MIVPALIVSLRLLRFKKVRFEERSVDAPRALLAFMNTLATDNSQALAGSKWCASRSALLLPPSLTF
jgi:hypothetical protein